MSKRFLPVIHVVNDWRAELNARIAFEHGADGVFLICHRANYHQLESAFFEVRRRHPHQWIGLNYLDLRVPLALERIQVLKNVQALWADDDLTSSDGTEILPIAEKTHEWREAFMPKLEYFGSVAFKGQMKKGDPAIATATVSPYVSVVTTSGPATGVPASVEHVQAVRSAAAGKRVALASGVSAENVQDYLPFVDDYLVSSSISTEDEDFNVDKLHELATLIHQ